MASSNCVADVRKLATAALKSGHKFHGAVLKPSQWAKEAGYSGSDASPLRKHMARDSGNGCGRQSRYPAMTAEVLLETLDLADNYVAEKAEAKRDALAKRIGARVRPAKAGAVQAKGQAKQSAKSGRKAKASA